MATDIRSLPAYLSTDALFRSWGGGVSAQFAACGLTQASDTGQINWTTVTLPSTSSYGGYEIWDFESYKLKIEYGIASAANRPALRVQLGTATNGAGTLTGQYTGANAVVLNPAASKSGTGDTLPSYCCVVDGGLYLWNHLDANTATFCNGLAVECSLDATGAVTSDGAVIVARYGNSASLIHVLASTGSTPTSANSPAFMQLSYMQTNVGSNRALIPFTWCVNGKTFLTRLMYYLHADIGELSPITSSWKGTTTFMPMGDGAQPTSGLAFMSPWE